MRQLTVRVAWHDSGWDARVGQAPSRNSYCISLDRIREERDDSAEDANAGRLLTELTAEQHPPCVAEGTPFMNSVSTSGNNNTRTKRSCGTRQLIPEDVPWSSARRRGSEG